MLTASPALASDPLEAVNRQVHGFNVLAQRHVLGPVAAAYRAWTPAAVRAAMADVVANLGEPVTAVSALLAGDVDVATTAAVRFGINSTMGMGGVRDVAAERGYARQRMGVGDALCRWGVPSGPYLVLPLLGPSSLRDAGGMAVASLALSQAVGGDALLAVGAGVSAVEYAAVEPQLRRIEATALDSYATYRSLWRQQRVAACPQDAVVDVEVVEDD